MTPHLLYTSDCRLNRTMEWRKAKTCPSWYCIYLYSVLELEVLGSPNVLGMPRVGIKQNSLAEDAGVHHQNTPSCIKTLVLPVARSINYCIPLWGLFSNEGGCTAQGYLHPEVVIGSLHWIQECKHLGSFLDQFGAIPALELPMGLARTPGVEQCGSTFLPWFPHDFFTSLKIFPTAPRSNHQHTNLWLRIHFPENPIKDTSSAKPPNRLNRNSTTLLYTVYLYSIENV